jgi:hypothetical protein
MQSMSQAMYFMQHNLVRTNSNAQVALISIKKNLNWIFKTLKNLK